MNEKSDDVCSVKLIHFINGYTAIYINLYILIGSLLVGIYFMDSVRVWNKYQCHSLRDVESIDKKFFLYLFSTFGNFGSISHLTVIIKFIIFNLS